MTDGSFTCRLCKNEKRIIERSKFILWQPFKDLMIQGDLCNLCTYKMIRILNTKHLSDETKDELKRQVGLDLFTP